MGFLKPLILTCILPCMAVLAFIAASCNKEADTGFRICKQEYALCSAALCVPKPGDPKKSICFCDVHEGDNLSTVSCEELAPRTNEKGVRTIYSTYSLENVKKGNMIMTCPGGTPWSWCLNKQCTVDPTNPKKAICLCDIKSHSGDWVTYGGNCDTSTCATGYWSGASVEDDIKATQFFVKALGLDKSPVKWCPAK